MLELVDADAESIINYLSIVLPSLLLDPIIDNRDFDTKLAYFSTNISINIDSEMFAAVKIGQNEDHVTFLKILFLKSRKC